MNLYLVVSQDELRTHGSNYEPPEYYYLTELVIAKNPSQARYLAWKEDRGNFYPDYLIEEMPKFHTSLKLKGLEGPARVISQDFDLLRELADMVLWTYNYGK
jgi:hypothetical protein